LKVSWRRQKEKKKKKSDFVNRRTVISMEVKQAKVFLGAFSKL
jgi:hypothetical protein